MLHPITDNYKNGSILQTLTIIAQQKKSKLLFYHILERIYNWGELLKQLAQAD